MDVDQTASGEKKLDARQQFQTDLDCARAQRDDLEAAIAKDSELISAIRVALDSMAAAVWRDVFAQQQRAKRDVILFSALKLAWLGSMQFPAIGALLVVAVSSTMAFRLAGAVVSASLYALFFIVGYYTSRDRALVQVKKARSTYLGDDGRDLRFVAFTHCESGMHHPLIGFDGPQRNGTFADRSWKIPGLRDDEALQEIFVEVIDERRSSVLLTRFPDKKPTLVHADLENPFIRGYGVFFQRALERNLPSVSLHAQNFREAVLRAGALRIAKQRCATMERELHEFDGTVAALSQTPLSPGVRDKLLRAVMSFRMGDSVARHGTMLFARTAIDIKDIVETAARAGAAAFVPFSFSSLKIGYVGQGAAQVARAFENARRCRSVIFIEDGDKLFDRTGSTGFEPMRREIEQAFLKQWEALEERSDVWIVAAVHDRESIDPAIVSHFGTLIDLTPKAKEDAAPMMADVADRPIFEESFVLPQTACERIEVLAAMFAHAEAMERQGIIVPRAVLFAASSSAARRAAIHGIASRSGLSVVHAGLIALDDAMAEADAGQPAIVVVELPDIADPGSIAHLCVTLDELHAGTSQTFLIATVRDLPHVDPELRERFGETIDIPGVDASTRRETLYALLSGKPLDFNLEQHIDAFARATEGMSEDRLHDYVENAVSRAAMRAIALGEADNVNVTLGDFGRVEREPQTAA